MSDNKTDYPAFPEAMVISPAGSIHQSGSGMSLRDYFAGQALAGMVAGAAGLRIATFEFAEQSYSIADAMLAEREKRDL